MIHNLVTGKNRQNAQIPEVPMFMEEVVGTIKHKKVLVGMMPDVFVRKKKFAFYEQSKLWH